MVSGSLSPPYSGYFSPFPHGTGSLSVSQEYLALPDGAGGFRRDFSGPALLRIPLGPKSLRARGCHPLRRTFPGACTSIFGPMAWSYNPDPAVTGSVWALARSLATTCAIIVIFSSSGYLDVSVPRVCLQYPMYSGKDSILLKIEGFPIRKSLDQSLLTAPQSISVLVPSFIGS